MNFKNKSLPTPVILGACLVITLLWAYWPVLHHLFKQLLNDEDYSFGLLLPLVSGYIVFLKWPEIRRGPWRSSWLGLPVLALSLGLYIFGEASIDYYTARVSFIVALGGVIFLFGGWRLVRFLGFPLLLLLLMIPLPHMITLQITLPLQLLSSRLATEMLQIIGVPVVRQGNIIDLGVRQLQIVSACSGLRYILALSALGIIFCYFYQRRPWKAALLLLSLLPAAISANALRVAGMGIFPALQEGFWHGFSGWLIFIFCFGFLSLLNLLLNHIQPGTQGEVESAAPPETVEVDGRRSAYLPYLIALIIVLGVGGFAQVVGKIPPMPLLQSLDNFPLGLGPWQGKRSYIDPAMFRATGADSYLNADFRAPGHDSINLWIAYYENQKPGGYVHSPFSCLVGSGWKMKESGIKEVAPGVPVRYMVMDQAGGRYLVYYWYLQRGRWLTSEYWNKIYIGYDGLLNRRADGALIRLITPAEKDVNTAQERLTSFVQQLMPVLPKFIKK